MKYELLTGLIGLLCLVTGFWAATLKPVAAVSFTPPTENAAPRQSSGGASRGNFNFVPPSDNRAPANGTGGASRSGFMPPTDNSAPRQAAAGASRGVNFIPPPDSSLPSQATGGASRNGFVPPPDNANPQTAAAGASRANTYGNVEEFLTGSAVSMLAVTPSNFYGLTVSDHPTIMAYLPASAAEQAIFSLKDENQNVVYQQVIPVSGEAGILTVTLPADAPALEEGHYYQWFVTLQLEDNLTPASPFVDAWIKRVAPSDTVAQAMTSGNAIATAEALAQAGIWYDAAAILANLQSTQTIPSETLANDWTELLSSVGLEELVESSLLSAAPSR